MVFWLFEQQSPYVSQKFWESITSGIVLTLLAVGVLLLIGQYETVGYYYPLGFKSLKDIQPLGVCTLIIFCSGYVFQIRKN